MNSRRPAALFLGALLLTAACTSTTGHDSAPAGPSGAPGAASASPSGTAEASPSPAGAVRTLTSAEVQNGWWNWAASIDKERSPMLDMTGARCAEGQREGIWYLAGMTGGDVVQRSCTVPVGVPVVFPAVTIFGEASDCLAFMDAAKGSAALDGTSLTPEPLDATPIDLVAAPDSAFGKSAAQAHHTWSCGLWVRLDPLTPGKHELTVRGESGSPAFASGVDYHLNAATPSPTSAA
ncbi:signal protein [Kitasatospora misakiensis]|uniref:Signal protein n=1 Tax=Kitasatospora misakiensis TaxID=67330 RepID=A0ABW0WYQ9_9ACTN